MTEENKEDVFQDLPEKGLSQESAQKVFDEILEYYDIDFDDIVNDQGKEGAETLQNKLVRSIKQGRIETNLSDESAEGFQIIQHTRDGKTFTYNEYNAKAAEESDKAKGVSASQYRLLGSLSGQGETIKKMRGPDLKLAEYVAVLFLL
jgi:hypothetical protein